MGLERYATDEEVSRRELAQTDYQITREVEKLLPRLKQLLDDSGVDTTDVDLARVDDKKRGDARARIALAKGKRK